MIEKPHTRPHTSDCEPDVHRVRAESPRLDSGSLREATGSLPSQPESPVLQAGSGQVVSGGGGEAESRIPHGPHTNPHTACAVTRAGRPRRRTSFPEQYAFPVPGCECPPSYVRDVCHGHPVPGCPFKGLFGLDLRDAHRTAWEHARVFGDASPRNASERVA